MNKYFTFIINWSEFTLKMAKTNKKYQESPGKEYLKDDYEDFGYKVTNAKRYSNRNKQQRKFKDIVDFEDWQATLCHFN